MDKRKKKIKKNFVDQGLAAKSTKQGKATSALFNPNSSINPPDLNNQFCNEPLVDYYYQAGNSITRAEDNFKAGSIQAAEQALAEFEHCMRMHQGTLQRTNIDNVFDQMVRGVYL